MAKKNTEDPFPFARDLYRDNRAEFSAISGPLSRCKAGTMYRPPSRPQAPYSHSELDAVTTRMLVDEYVECIRARSAREAAAIIRRVASEIASSRRIPPELVCPAASARLSAIGSPQSIYDIDGIDYLCWTALCDEASRGGIPRARERCACQRLVPRTYTCFPSRAITPAAARRCFVPESIAERTEADLQATEWDARREATIADAFRSTLFGGPAVASIIASGVCAIPRATTDGGTAAPAKPKVAKKQRQTKKLGDVRLRRIAAGRAAASEEGTSGADVNMSVEAAKSVLAERVDGDAPPEDERVLAAAYALARGASEKTKAASSSRKVTGPVRGEDEFGDTALDVPVEAFLSGGGASADAPDGIPAPRTLEEFASREWGGGRDAVRCAWIDSVASDAALGDPYEDAYPCACSAELIAGVADGCRKCVVDHEMRSACDARPFPRVSSPDIPAASLRDAVRAVYLDLAFGTLHSSAAKRDGFVRLVNSNRSLMYSAIPDAIQDAVAAAGRVSKWRAPAVNRGRAASASAGIPFARDPAEVAAEYEATRVPTADASPIETRAGILRTWCGLVHETRDEFCARPRSRRAQTWYFAPVDLGSTIADLARRVDAAGMYGRAIELASAAMHAGHSGSAAGGGSPEVAQVAVLSPPSTWPCDACLGAALAADSLEARQVSVGIPVCIGGGATAIVLPNRRTGPTDGIVFGSMISALGGGTRARPDIAGCAMIYPFAFVALVAAPSARRTEAERDDERRMAEAGGDVKRAQDRAPGWDAVMRAATAFLSDACLRTFASDGVPEPGTQPADGIPPFAEDTGAVCWDVAAQRRGWIDQTGHEHQRAAMRACETAFALLLAASPEPSGESDWAYARGFACATRPMREWTTTGRDSRVAIGGGMCLARRTDENIAHLRSSAEGGLESARAALRSLALAPYRSDQTCPAFARCPIGDDSCGDGSEVLARGMDLERPASYPDYDECLDGSQVPSLDLLASEFLATVSRGKRTESLDAALAFMWRMEISRRTSDRPIVITTTSAIADCISKNRSKGGIAGIPLAVRACDGSFIRADAHVPVADSPFSLAGSRPIVCDVCGTSAELARTASDALHGGALLPKNSPLMDEMMHRRRGAVMMQHAWPAKQGGAQQSYAALAVRSIAAAPPVDGGDAAGCSSIQLDPDAFEISMMAEASETRRAEKSGAL